MNEAVRNARIKGLTEMCRILLEEEIPFHVTTFDDHIYIDEKSQITKEQLLEVFYKRPDLSEASRPASFAVMTADEVFVEVLCHKTDKTIDLRISLLEDP